MLVSWIRLNIVIKLYVFVDCIPKVISIQEI